MCPASLTPTENPATLPAKVRGAGCPSPFTCRQLHCAVCTTHLENPQQRFCSSRCRSRARSLRKQRLACPNCGAELWLRRREGMNLVVPKDIGK